MIAGVLPFISDEKECCYAISRMAERHNISKQTVKNTLCLSKYISIYQRLHQKILLPEIKVGGDLLENTDMMRGEETEFIGLSEKLQSGCIYVLPGSHSKLIKTDEQGRISSFVTTLTGEMIFALSQSTILKDAVDFSQTETDFEWIQILLPKRHK